MSATANPAPPTSMALAPTLRARASLIARTLSHNDRKGPGIQAPITGAPKLE